MSEKGLTIQVILLLLFVIFLVGCSPQQPDTRLHCINSMSGYIVIVGNETFTDCKMPHPCMSSGCTFECGDVEVHSNDYYKRCP